MNFKALIHPVFDSDRFDPFEFQYNQGFDLVVSNVRLVSGFRYIKNILLEISKGFLHFIKLIVQSDDCLKDIPRRNLNTAKKFMTDRQPVQIVKSYY